MTSSGSTANTKCCLARCWDAICNFFRSICPCLFGRSKPEVPETPEKPKTTNERERIVSKKKSFGDRCTQLYGPNFEPVAVEGWARQFMNFYGADKNESLEARVEAFAEILPLQMQWQALYLITQLPTQDCPLEHIGAYICSCKEIETEVFAALDITEAAELTDTNKNAEELRKKLDTLLQGKRVSNTPTSAPAPQNSGQGKLPVEEPERKNTGEGAKAPVEHPEAVRRFLEQRNRRPMNWFDSDACTQMDRIEILIYLANTARDMTDIRDVYLHDWSKREKPDQVELLLKKTGAKTLSEIRDKSGLIEFLEQRLESLQAEQLT